jgi:hypothetical protein
MMALHDALTFTVRRKHYETYVICRKYCRYCEYLSGIRDSGRGIGFDERKNEFPKPVGDAYISDKSASKRR